ncbi:MAG TPA: L-serine ammonia-lyase, iron-sulfur-dependent, subunit alpha [Thermotogota bacterium]|nr:L-serine ammonia-lyase, iron-sulfur-dependent, subunit alpha [Thermotogota bacterium]HRW93265.1 L-serine ammonia-lyase, iron-sulfur-dependent, subunit alpha [Thermotogota bacterium]
MTFHDLIALSQQSDLPLHEVVLMLEMSETGVDPQALQKKLSCWLVELLEEEKKQYAQDHKTLTGWTGCNARLVAHYGARLLSPFVHTATVAALSMAESNAAMGKVLACPTAGSCGVLPGILFACQRILHKSTEEIGNGFVVAGAIGNIIAARASISGAQAGCQAEIGTATAMASSCLAYILGGDCQVVGNAAALSLKALMGLVCDPVGGFVEVPCVKRNAVGVSVATSTAEMALSGVESLIPLDEVVLAMQRVGRMMHPDLKETGMGGIAISASAHEKVREFLEKSPGGE